MRVIPKRKENGLSYTAVPIENDFKGLFCVEGVLKDGSNLLILQPLKCLRAAWYKKYSRPVAEKYDRREYNIRNIKTRESFLSAYAAGMRIQQPRSPGKSWRISGSRTPASWIARSSSSSITTVGRKTTSLTEKGGCWTLSRTGDTRPRKHGNS